MKLLSVNALKKGDALFSNITSCKGMVMLKNGTALTDTYIERLKKVGIYAVYVDDDFSDDMEIRPALSDDTKLRVLDILSTVHANFSKGRKIDFDTTKKITHEIFDEVKSAVMMPINLVNTYAVDYPILLHSINVAVIVAAMAGKAEIRRDLAESYIMGAMFHDIALASIDDDKDPEHAATAHKMLRDSAVVGPNTYMSVALHHEKYDGTGKPNRIAGKEISEGARMIAVADMYDNLVFGYAGYKQMSPYKAVEYLTVEAGKSIDPDLTELFSRCVAVYPTGSTVLLNNGSEAIVISQNAGVPTRPVVRLIKGSKEDYEVLNLLWEHTVFINELYL